MKRIPTLLLAALILVTGALGARASEAVMVPNLRYAQKPLPDLESFSFVRSLEVGWNLGNTFDAVNAAGLRDELDYESAWVGVKTDARVFAALREAGFGVVRIPVSWHNHVSGPDFTISAPWLARVREVADMALEAGLRVILNTHHDIEKGFIYPDDAHLEDSRHYLTSVWRQVAAEFREYDDRLILESMNEPRLPGTPIEWWLDANDPRSAEAVKAINALNQAFVDTVRADGGHNASRYLLVPGYAASVQGFLHPDFRMPTDIPGMEDRLIASVHAYTPYDFALQSPDEPGNRDAFSAENPLNVNEIAVFMESVYQKSMELQTPVLIGEFGARDKRGNLQARVDFTAAYVALARARGFTCLWWDNHAFQGNGELFGLLDRRTFAWRYPDIVRAMTDNAK
ncbi:MAG TPA: glycoside hydrolase family 5 protein [Candidatus Limnocylindria bacterium]|nr:glycoside hydrolase family 5 protein [Candidatus Limnocylindria bacterium]